MYIRKGTGVVLLPSTGERLCSLSRDLSCSLHNCVGRVHGVVCVEGEEVGFGET